MAQLPGDVLPDQIQAIEGQVIAQERGFLLGRRYRTKRFNRLSTLINANNDWQNFRPQQAGGAGRLSPPDI
jgi:hypothetical protein